MNKPKLLFVVGSFRKNSFNKELAEMAKTLIGDRAEVSFLNYKDLPYMNQDLEADPPESVLACRKAFKDADGIWFFTAEYNGFLPGLLKNLLDWMSRPIIPGNYASGTAIKGKKTTSSGVGGSNKTKGSRGQLETLLKRIGAQYMAEPSCGFGVGPDVFKSDHWDISEEDKKELEKQIDAFLKFVE